MEFGHLNPDAYVSTSIDRLVKRRVDQHRTTLRVMGKDGKKHSFDAFESVSGYLPTYI